MLLEALAFEVPVIASDAGAARSILSEGVCGRLLPGLSEPALRSALSEVLADPADAAERARLGRERVEHGFTLADNTDKLVRLLRAAATQAR